MMAKNNIRNLFIRTKAEFYVNSGATRNIARKLAANDWARVQIFSQKLGRVV
jgi:hypothetical protein